MPGDSQAIFGSPYPNTTSSMLLTVSFRQGCARINNSAARGIKTGLLDVRPIFVRKEERTRGHVFCCMLALKLTREIEKRLRAAFATTDTNPKAIPLPDALASLARLCLLHYSVDEKTTVTKLPLPDSRQQRILSALKVKLPAM